MKYFLLNGFHAMLPMEAIVPSQPSDISEGDYVKIGVETVCHRTEKFWAVVYAIDRDNGTFGVRVNNDLQFTRYHGLRDKSELIVNFNHIVGVMK